LVVKNLGCHLPPGRDIASELKSGDQAFAAQQQGILLKAETNENSTSN
jgi:hypothetical protein